MVATLHQQVGYQDFFASVEMTTRYCYKKYTVISSEVQRSREI